MALLATAVNVHQISLLGARGLTSAQAAANFIPQTVARLLATLAAGYPADRVRHKWMVLTAMVSLAGGLAWPTQVTPGFSAFLFGRAAHRCVAVVVHPPRLRNLTHAGYVRRRAAAVTYHGGSAWPLAM